MISKVMIVDDDPDTLESIKSILEYHHYEAIIARSGRECLKKIEEGFKGIILIDILMPEMNGWDTIREIIDKGFIKNVAINILTGLVTKDQQMMGIYEPYVYDYLTKPVEVNQLMSSVKKCNTYLSARENIEK